MELKTKKGNFLNNGIPVSVSMTPALEAAGIHPTRISYDKKRLLQISAISVLVAAMISVIAKLLIYLINIFTNIFFHGTFSLEYISPASHSLGLLVIFVPVLGGVIVGLMALYGSKAIRGHGIPEAMEQILTNQSKVKPAIIFLKPLSSAISIGTGGPFGAEGPIISTGGAFGSTIGQIFKISPNERKILLAAGATAGMSAIFGTPIAAIFLAIELLLFEFSPRSIIPVALACITGAAGHHVLFEETPVFPMPMLVDPGNLAVAVYSMMGVIIGLLSAAITKIVYFIEDSFELLPVHWVWWPAIGGLAVGIIGFFAPRTLGVGYENITGMLSGSMSFRVILSLCILKFLSWAIALGSGTSGGTLAPLLTIGGASGALLGSVVIYLFPDTGVTIPLAVLVGMAAMFAGASRALLTSIVFALETTLQPYALLPLLGACTASYSVSFFFLENTIMTEKIARRGIKTPDSYEPDILEKIRIEQVLKEDGFVISAENTVQEVRDWLNEEGDYTDNYIVVADNDGNFKGITSLPEIFSKNQRADVHIDAILRGNPVTISQQNNLRNAVELMADEDIEVLPVLSNDNKVIGIITHKDIISAYKHRLNDDKQTSANISIKRRRMKILLHGQKFFTILKGDKRSSRD